MKSHSHILSKSVPILKGDQVEGPEDESPLQTGVNQSGAHLQMASCCQSIMAGYFFFFNLHGKRFYPLR